MKEENFPISLNIFPHLVSSRKKERMAGCFWPQNTKSETNVYLQCRFVFDFVFNVDSCKLTSRSSFQQNRSKAFLFPQVARNFREVTLYIRQLSKLSCNNNNNYGYSAIEACEKK